MAKLIVKYKQKCLQYMKNEVGSCKTFSAIKVVNSRDRGAISENAQKSLGLIMVTLKIWLIMVNIINHRLAQLFRK